MNESAQRERLEAGLALGLDDTAAPPMTGTPMRLRVMLKQLDLLIPTFWTLAPSQVVATLAEKEPALLEALSEFSPETLAFAIRTQRIVQRDLKEFRDRNRI